MNLFKSLVEKIKLNASLIFKGNKKVNQKNSISPVNVESEQSAIFNINSLTVINTANVAQLASQHPPENLSELMQDAGKLFLAERGMKQIGFNEAVSKAKLDEIESPAQIDRGWFLNWMEIAQKTSPGDVQDLIAKILRGEFQSQNTFSLRTLEVLKNLNQGELNIFQIFCNILTRSKLFGNDAVITEPFGGNPGNNDMQSIGLSYSNLTILQDAGLIHSEMMGAHRTITDPKLFLTPFNIGENNFSLQSTEQVQQSEGQKINISILRLTQAGFELSNVMPLGSNKEYNLKFLEWISGKWKFVPIE